MCLLKGEECMPNQIDFNPRLMPYIIYAKHNGKSRSELCILAKALYCCKCNGENSRHKGGLTTFGCTVEPPYKPELHKQLEV